MQKVFSSSSQGMQQLTPEHDACLSTADMAEELLYEYLLKQVEERIQVVGSG